jgi:hypothetical protein
MAGTGRLPHRVQALMQHADGGSVVADFRARPPLGAFRMGLRDPEPADDLATASFSSKQHPGYNSRRPARELSTA